MSDHQRFPNLPAGEGEPGQSAPEIEQLQSRLQDEHHRYLQSERAVQTFTAVAKKWKARADESESRLRVAVEALRELVDVVHDYVLSRGAIDYEPGSDPESWDVMQAKRDKAVKALASPGER